VTLSAALVGITARRLTLGHKPEIVYAGAEYCPFCAVTRWPLAIALLRFGSFTGLEQSGSSLYDLFPGTRTLSFATARYSSPYLAFDSSEIESNACTSLDDGECRLGGGPAHPRDGQLLHRHVLRGRRRQTRPGVLDASHPTR
jgi:hypothetical protein